MPTQKTDIYHSATTGLSFSGSQRWIIADGVYVGSQSDRGVGNGFPNGELINKGHIYSADDTGVNFQGDNNTIINRADADIFGATGVYMFGNDCALTNQGRIVGYDQYGVRAFGTPRLSLDNDGEIRGQLAGVAVSSVLVGQTGGTVDNSGLIHAATYGVAVNTDPGERTTIVNEQGGTIKGGTLAVYSVAGKVTLENHGMVKGGVGFGGANAGDKVFNDGTIKGVVALGPGKDLYKNTGGKAGKVFGGDGNDKLIAGPHVDKFAFASTLNAATNVDRVKHFEPGTDKFFLYNGVFTNLNGPGTLTAAEFHKGAHAHDATDRIIYDSTTGALYYDSNGNAAGGEVQFAKLDTGLHLHHGDFTVYA